jgi:RNA polymerase sigma factor (sigma-70 family)
MVVASGDVRLPRFLRREAGAEVDRLYRRHADEVFRYALMVMRSRPDAEDIVQTVFVRALRAIERGEKVRAPRNWLIKIAHNECRRMLSARKTHAELPDEIAVEPIETGRATELRAAMAALPKTQRQALVLRELEGRTYVEIATSLGLTVSAVETLIFRARRTLREQIEAAMSCEDFALLLDDPDARSRIRAHARVCAHCATLERQARGRKSALKRIASMLGLPWWGAKIAAVGLTAATAAGVVAVAATPHHHHPRNLVPAHAGTRLPSVTPTKLAPRPAVAKVSDTRRV